MVEETKGETSAGEFEPMGSAADEEGANELAGPGLDSSTSMSLCTATSSSTASSDSGSDYGYGLDSAWSDNVPSTSTSGTDESMEVNRFIQARTTVDVPETITATDSSGSRVTLYKIMMESNSICFHVPSACTWRSFSDFVWLRKRLTSSCSFTKREIPDLPTRNLLNLFDKDFAERRKEGLQTFLRKVISDRSFISDAAFHLFLQSDLRTDEIQAWLEKKNDKSVYELIMRGKGISLPGEGPLDL